MYVKRNEKQAISLTVTEGLTVTILPSSNHEFLMPSSEVAKGYGVSSQNIREHKRINEEFTEGKHFVTGVRISDSDPSNKVYWTKRGVIRLGFFIKSDRAKMFRNWAEELILDKLEKQPVRQLPSKRNYYNNRLTHERLLDIMADVCKIDDKVLRLSISEKLMKGGAAC